jgi:putative transposase
MSKYKKISHSIYYCLYHIVWLPKYRYKILEGVIKEFLEEEIRKLSEYKGVEIIELNVQKDHIHMLVSIPPKISVSEYMGYIKGKTAIKMFQANAWLRKKPYWGNHFWARGYFVSTVGLEEEVIRKYIKYQEDEEKKIEENQNNFSLF